MQQDWCVLAVDLGTSGCKTALVTGRGEVLDWAFEPVTTLYFPNGGAEQRPGDWWDAFIKTSRALLARHPERVSAVGAVCFSTQGEGTVPVDADGNALGNCILWMDTRGAEHLKCITAGLVKVSGYNPWRLFQWIRLTGGAPTPTGKDPAAHMLYIKHEQPDVYRRTHKFLNVLDYLNHRLTGRFTATVDSILTSWVTDNRDPDNIKYSARLLKYSQIDADKFPEIVRCADVLGTLTSGAAAELGLPESVAVVAGAIDVTAAALGSGAVNDYEPHLYLATSSWMAAHVPFKKTDITTSLASVPCAVPGRHLLIALQATAGGNLTFLRDRVLYHKDELLQEGQVPDVYKIMDRIAAKVPAGSNGVLYTPWIYGERAPVEDRHIRAGLHNLSLENSREDIIRAVYEGVAYNTRWMLKPVEKFLGRPSGPIRVIGGGACSDIWCQIFADVMNRPMLQLKDPIQANVRGAAFIAAVGMGKIRFDEIPGLTEIKAEYKPNPGTRAIHDAHFREFTEIYRHNRKVYRRLNAQRLGSDTH